MEQTHAEEEPHPLGSFLKSEEENRGGDGEAKKDSLKQEAETSSFSFLRSSRLADQEESLTDQNAESPPTSSAFSFVKSSSSLAASSEATKPVRAKGITNKNVFDFDLFQVDNQSPFLQEASPRRSSKRRSVLG
jgi:hypothetical protein